MQNRYLLPFQFCENVFTDQTTICNVAESSRYLACCIIMTWWCNTPSTQINLALDRFIENAYMNFVWDPCLQINHPVQYRGVSTLTSPRHALGCLKCNLLLGHQITRAASSLCGTISRLCGDFMGDKGWQLNSRGYGWAYITMPCNWYQWVSIVNSLQAKYAFDCHVKTISSW